MDLLIGKEGPKMKKKVFVSVLAIALILIYAAGESMACGMKDQVRVSKLLGTTVKDSDGIDFAVIIDYMRDPTSRAAFVILTYNAGEELEQGGRVVAVPYSLFSCAEQDCTLSIARDGLDFAPTFTSKENFAEHKLASDVYRHFGLQPYWTDKETTKSEIAPETHSGYDGY
jgi:hypothetical protein